ncbi:MAG: hypothetical protein JWN40_4628, partial [Phycisphaerales bacterium]|nr:hypothetical protein [Phycisphaerales bacterium]
MNSFDCLLRRRRHGRDARDTISLLFFLCALCAFAARLFAADKPKVYSNLDGGANDVYKFESLADPEESKGLEVGGMGWTADGKLALCTRHGEVWMRSENGEYKRFASGLHECLGLYPGDSRGELFVMQRTELTKISDVDGDGEADKFETFNNSWGYNGNYHSFAFGLVKDKEGNFCGTLCLAHKPDNSGGVFMGTQKETPYRGCSFKITPKGEFIPFSYGLRAPNGIAINDGGDLFATDNQGEFVSVGSLHHLTEGAFHGHPSSLIFKPGWDRPLNTVTDAEWDKMRKWPAVLLPYPQMGHSQGCPIFDTAGEKFGPFAGQMFLGDVIDPLIMRITLEKVQGEYQGACYPFMRRDELKGSNRLIFHPTDGSLYVGTTDRGWSRGSTGLQRIAWTGKPVFDIKEMAIAKGGFTVTFTQAVDPASAADLKSWNLTTWHYKYGRQYGSPDLDKQPVKITSVQLSPDNMQATLSVEELHDRQWIYYLSADGIKTPAGQALRNKEAYYTL